MLNNDNRDLEGYLSGLRSEETRKLYAFKLRKFFQHREAGPQDFLALVKRSPEKALDEIISYLRFLRDDKKLSGSSIEGSRNAIAGFVENSRPKTIDFRLVSRSVGITRNKKGADRIPSVNEIRRLLGQCDLRSKALILLLCSSGMRIGAIQTLKWNDVSEIAVMRQRFAKMNVYAGTNDQYTSFVTPEAYRALMEYRNEREIVYGERIHAGSYVISKFPIGASEAKPGLSVPSTKYLERYFGDLWRSVGLRRGNETGNDHVVRHEFKVFLGLRKFFKTWCEASGMRSDAVGILMGSTSASSRDNQIISEAELGKSYAAAIPWLSIRDRYRRASFQVTSRPRRFLTRAKAH